MTKNKIIIFILSVGAIFIIVISCRRHTPLSSQNLETFISAPVQNVEIPKEIRHGDRSKKEVIFTFDAGGANLSGDKILEVLAKHHVKGTFFLTGKMIENNSSFVKSLASAGDEIFNHTYDHPILTTLSDYNITKELTKMHDALQNSIGISPKLYFRAPYGMRNARVLEIAANLGYQSVYWTVDALDWRGKLETPDQVRNRIFSSLAPGNIYLMHVSDLTTGIVLDDVFNTIEAKGYKIVSLTQGV